MREVENGVPLRKIHLALGLPGVSYKQFCLYVKRYAGRPHEQDGREVPAERSARAPATALGEASGTQARAPAPSGGGVVSTEVGFPRVTHNPNARSHEDLV